MVSLLTLVLLVLPVAAIPSEYRRDILDLLRGDASVLLPPDPFRVTTTKNLTSASTPSSSTINSTWTPTPTLWTESATTSIKTTVFSTPSILPVSAASQAIDHSSKTWQIVGITILSVLFIATSITCAMFFDRLWKFLKDVICCTSRPLVSEQFIPDCETQSWLSPWSSDLKHSKSESLYEESVYTRTRELPWNALYRQSSRRNDFLPTA